jgi:hypothetical protein
VWKALEDTTSMYLAAPGVDAGCGVVEGDVDGEVHNLFVDVINELAAVQLPPELEL